MNGFEIVLYTKADGTQPAKDFITSLDAKLRAKMFRGIELLKYNGNELREPYTKVLEDGILELRGKQGSDIARVLYFFTVGRKIILTNGFVKKTQQTPHNKIAIAKKYREDYMNRFCNKEG